MVNALKNVEFVGFETHPELRPLADRANTVLNGIVQPWQDEVQVVWQPAPPASGAILELTISMTLWNAADSNTGFIRRRSFEAGEEGSLRSDIRFIWMELLAKISAQQMKRLNKMIHEPVEG